MVFVPGVRTLDNSVELRMRAGNAVNPSRVVRHEQPMLCPQFRQR